MRVAMIWAFWWAKVACLFGAWKLGGPDRHPGVFLALLIVFGISDVAEYHLLRRRRP